VKKTSQRAAKPYLSEHQKQIRFFTIFFAALAVLIVVLVLWFLNFISSVP
jgi:hypothetical protein